MNGFFVARRLAVVALSMFALSVQASAQMSLNLPKGASLALLVTAGAVGDASGFKLTGTMQLPACNVAHVQQIPDGVDPKPGVQPWVVVYLQPTAQTVCPHNIAIVPIPTNHFSVKPMPKSVGVYSSKFGTYGHPQTVAVAIP
jgi:hypothetical protein